MERIFLQRGMTDNDAKWRCCWRHTSTPKIEELPCTSSSARDCDTLDSGTCESLTPGSGSISWWECPVGVPKPMRMMHLSALWAASVAPHRVRQAITRPGQSGQPLFWKLLSNAATVPAWMGLACCNMEYDYGESRR